MHALSASELLDVWERGQLLGPIGRGLELAAAACPPASEPETLSVGRRDALLCELREYTFGPVVEAVSDCPDCGEKIELNFRLCDLGSIATSASLQDQDFVSGNYTLRLRAPDSRDLARAAAVADPQEAWQLLFEGCVLVARHAEREIAPAELPPDVVAAAIARIAEADPGAEVLLAVTCPRCQVQSRVLFDILAFFWREIETFASRLLREVHMLASAYGWQESHILAMSAVRRRRYLDMVGA
jgi:hypothetical protein